MRQEVAKGIPLVREDLQKRGFRTNTLSEMAARGTIYRVGRGVYTPASGSASEFFDYELATKVVPRGVFTLVSALRLHGLTDENPQRMTMAIPSTSHAPKTTLPVDFVYMTPALLSVDVVERNPYGTAFHLFSVERTIVECFKARNKIGLGIAVAAFKDAAARNMIDYSMLWTIMGRCRMVKIISPYLEAFA